MALLLFVLFADASVATPRAGAREYIVPAERARLFYEGQKSERFWTPSRAEIERLRPKLGPFISQHLGQTLESYSRQYVGVIVGGRKLIWTYAFGLDDGRIDEPVLIDDGGCSVWRVFYDVKNGAFSGLECNGEA